jgi:hypothetical protein
MKAPTCRELVGVISPRAVNGELHRLKNQVYQKFVRVLGAPGSVKLESIREKSHAAQSGTNEQLRESRSVWFSSSARVQQPQLHLADIKRILSVVLESKDEIQGTHQPLRRLT